MTLIADSPNAWILCRAALHQPIDLAATPVLLLRLTDAVSLASRTVTLTVLADTYLYLHVAMTIGAPEDLPAGVAALTAGAQYEAAYLAQEAGPEPPPATVFFTDLITVR